MLEAIDDQVFKGAFLKKRRKEEICHDFKGHAWEKESPLD